MCSKECRVGPRQISANDSCASQPCCKIERSSRYLRLDGAFWLTAKIQSLFVTLDFFQSRVELLTFSREPAIGPVTR